MDIERIGEDAIFELIDAYAVTFNDLLNRCRKGDWRLIKRYRLGNLTGNQIRKLSKTAMYQGDTDVLAILLNHSAAPRRARAMKVLARHFVRIAAMVDSPMGIYYCLTELRVPPRVAYKAAKRKSANRCLALLFGSG